MKKAKNIISEIKKYSKEKKFFLNNQKIRIQSESSLGTLARTFLSSLIIISIFFITPIIINFKNENKLFSKNYENNSKSNFKKTLENQSSKSDNQTNNNYLFDDILDFEDLPKDTIRLSASTIEQLFKDTNYNLKDVRKTKLVKPVTLSLLPEEIKKIENVKKRKELFIQIILPLVIKENNNIKFDRIRLFSILNKSKNTKEEKNWLKKKFQQYGVMNKDLSTLKIRMDEVPVSMAIAQAAKETGWGTSRFAQQGNALFGQWTYDGDGIKPAGSEAGETHKVMKFKILKASVRAYKRNLNTHSGYKKFRKVRAIQRDVYGSLNSLELVKYLDKYAETGEEYTKILRQIIEQNKLTDFDDAKILPSSEREKNII